MAEKSKSDGKDEADPYANDPFFKRVFDVISELDGRTQNVWYWAEVDLRS
jgi:hypothetical protein